VCDLETSRMGAPYIYIYIYIYDISRLRVKAFGPSQQPHVLSAISDRPSSFFLPHFDSFRKEDLTSAGQDSYCARDRRAIS